MSNLFLSVIVPVYNEELSIQETVRRLRSVLRQLNSKYEILFVNDGSRDNTLFLLREEKKGDSNIKIINFSRNFGHQIAITAGMDYAAGDAAVIIDADLQDPPEVIIDMIKKWQEGFDVVHARRRRRLGETIFKQWTASFFYRLLKNISNINIPVDVGDFRLLSRKALNAFKQMKERHRYVRGLVAWLGYNQAFVDYDRDRRYAGKTNYPLTKMIKFSFDGISSFSILPLRIATFLGFLCSFLSFLYIFYALYVHFALKQTVLGWTTVIISIFFLGGIQLICLGIIGEYIGIIHEEEKQRPLYLIDSIN